MVTAREQLVVKFAGLVAIVGAMVEESPIDQIRVDAWCREIASILIPQSASARLRCSERLMIFSGE
jgi:hypothetical protein